MACYGEEGRAGAATFLGDLKAVMTGVDFDRVFPIMDVHRAANGALITL